MKGEGMIDEHDITQNLERNQEKEMRRKGGNSWIKWKEREGRKMF